MHRDIVVVGSGISGLVSGIQALESASSAEVLIVEKGPRLGGTTLLSGIAFWSADSLESLDQEIQSNRKDLLRTAIKQYDDSIEWLSEQGVPFSDIPEPTNLHPEMEETMRDIPRDKWVEPRELVDALTTKFESLGGEIRLRTPVERLLTENGGMSGVVVNPEETSQRKIGADCVILATGGFPGGEELIQQYITTKTDKISVRACPWCTGDGIHMATDLGAKLSPGMEDYYGVQMLAPPANYSPDEFVDVSALYGPFAIALAPTGQRFVDEAKSVREHTINRAAIEAEYGRVYYVFDSTVADASFAASQISPKEQLRKQCGRGANIAEVQSLTELAERLSQWGVDGERAVATLQNYNKAVNSEEPQALDVPRTAHHFVYDSPPWYAIEVQPSITQTFGGLEVDQQLRVMLRSGSSTQMLQATKEPEEKLRTPINSLYAVGAVVGHLGDTDIINPCSVHTALARIAGTHAAETVE